MCFPTAVKQIDLEAAASRLAAIYPNCSIAKIRTSFTVPSAELDNIDFVSRCADKMFAEISGKPARLQLQLGWDSLCGKQSQLADARSVAQLCVAIREEVPHARIMRRAWANVTPWVMHGCRV